MGEDDGNALRSIISTIAEAHVLPIAVAGRQTAGARQKGGWKSGQRGRGKRRKLDYNNREGWCYCLDSDDHATSCIHGLKDLFFLLCSS